MRLYRSYASTQVAQKSATRPLRAAGSVRVRACAKARREAGENTLDLNSEIVTVLYLVI